MQIVVASTCTAVVDLVCSTGIGMAGIGTAASRYYFSTKFSTNTSQLVKCAGPLAVLFLNYF